MLVYGRAQACGFRPGSVCSLQIKNQNNLQYQRTSGHEQKGSSIVGLVVLEEYRVRDSWVSFLKRTLQIWEFHAAKRKGSSSVPEIS